MTKADLKDLLERVQNWPVAAQDELATVAQDIETELLSATYLATQDELRAIDAAIASVDGGKIASQADVAKAFRRFHTG